MDYTRAQRIKEVEIVADELFETILFIIGIYFFDEKYYNSAIKIFEALQPLIINRIQNTEKTDIIRFTQIGRVNALLAELYFLQSIELYYAGEKLQSIQYLEKIRKVVANKIPVLMNLARAYYDVGNKKLAEVITKEIHKIDRHHPSVALNNSFFGILQKNYDRVKFWYDEILKKKNLQEISSLDIISFLSDEYAKNPSEHAFLYGMAILNHFVDLSSARNDLRRFLRLTKNRNEYLVLSNRAKELLLKLN